METKQREIKFRHWFPSTKIMTAGNHPHTFILTSDGKEDFWKDAVWLEFTGAMDKDGKEIYQGDIIKFELGFQSGDFDGDYKGVQGYNSENGFCGEIDFDTNRFEWFITKIKFEKAVNDPEYVFRMNKSPWQNRELLHYCSIKSKPLRKAQYPKVIGNIYSTPDLIK